MRIIVNEKYPQNICLNLYSNTHAPSIPSEEDVLSAIKLIKDEKNKQILLASFRDGRKLEDIGKSMGLSKERVRQRRNLALWEIRRIIFPPPKRVDLNDNPILPESNPLRNWNVPFEKAIYLTAAKANTLRIHGYHTIADVCKLSRNQLAELTGFGYRSAAIVADEIQALDRMQALQGNTQTIQDCIPDLPAKYVKFLYFYGFHLMSDFARVTPKKIANMVGPTSDGAKKIQKALYKTQGEKYD